MGIQSTRTISRSMAISKYFSMRTKCDLTNEELEDAIEEHFYNYRVLDDDTYEGLDEDEKYG